MGMLNILIAHKSFLVCKGIAVVLKGTISTPNVAVCVDEDSFAEMVFTLNPDVVIAGESFMKSLEHLDENEIKIIVVCNDHNDRGKFDHSICLTDSKQMVEESFSKLLPLEKDVNQNQIANSNELSEREVDIVKHVAMGFTNQEISDKLFISIHTVITHRKNITKKLGIKTVSGLTVFALINKIVDMSDVKK